MQGKQGQHGSEGSPRSRVACSFVRELSPHERAPRRARVAWRGASVRAQSDHTRPSTLDPTQPDRPATQAPNGGRRATGPRPDGGRRAHARRACSVSSVLTSDMTTLT